MVKTKNSTGLFLYTLLFFEALVMHVLFWILYFVLAVANATLCSGHLCSGVITGLFAFVNVVAGVCIFVLARSRTTLGIAFTDSFGM